MVGILLKIGKQSENVGEEEVFGRFCIRDVTENPSGGLLRRADIRPPEIGFCRLNAHRDQGAKPDFRRADIPPYSIFPPYDVSKRKPLTNYILID